MDALLLHALSNKQRFNSLRSSVPATMLAPDTSAILQWYAAYYTAFPERQDVVLDELQSLIRLRSGNASAEAINVTLHLTEVLRNPIDEVALNGILGQLYELDLSGRAAALIQSYQEGEEIDLTYELSRMSQTAMRAKVAASPADYLDTPIGELLAMVADDSGLKLRRIELLRDAISGLQGGASIAIAARPDKGKTSLIASILTDLAPQVCEMYGGKRPILWLNNEGSGKRIIPRVYQAALGKTLDEIILMSNTGVLVPAYTAAVGGVPDIIRVKDMHGATLAQIEQVLEAMNPAVVVGDMLSNFKIKADAGANKADSIEQIWQEWREMMVRHDAVGFGTVQISVEGDGILHPPYSALKDSKTGIQGATDVIIMLGAANGGPDGLRGISTPKNKFAVAGKPSCVKGDVTFDGARCIFTDGSSGAVIPEVNYGGVNEGARVAQAQAQSTVPCNSGT